MDHPEQNADERKPPLISKAIESILDRLGVPVRQRLRALEAAAGMDYQQVRRRMTGATPWTVDEIKRLASHFGEPLFQLLGALVDDIGHPATMEISGQSFGITVWPGKPIDDSVRTSPLAVVSDSEHGCWRVLPLADVGDQQAFEIRRLIFESPAPRRIAVVDDDAELSESIVLFLRRKGLDAVSYRTLEHARIAVETTSFDGYILDWTLSDGNVSPLLPVLRQRSPSAPVIILTGQIDAGHAQEDELAIAIAKFRCQLYEKPTRILSLFNALELGFSAPPSQLGTL